MRTIKSKTLISLMLMVLSTFITCSTIAQTAEDTTDGRFHDDLLNHLVGKWDVTGIVHGQSFKLNLEAEWVIGHQFLRVYEKSVEVVPWLNTQYEEEFFIGYNHTGKRYVIQEISILGCESPYEGFCYAYRMNNEIKLVKKDETNSETFAVQRFIWDPILKLWHIEARQVTNGKEGEILLDQKVVAAKN